MVHLPYNPGLDHALHGVHGGIYMTLLDTAAWFTSAITHEENCWIATSEMSVHFLKPSTRTALQAVGQIVKPGKRQDIVEAKLYDEKDQLVGHGMGTFIVLPSVALES